MCDASNRGAARKARFALAVIDAPATAPAAVVVTAFDVFGIDIHGRAVCDGFVEHVEDGAVEARQAARGNFRGGTKRVDAR